MKFFGFDFRSDRKCRSRKGAWIEIDGVEPMFADVSVAPVRERGLKLIITLITLF